MLMAQRPEDAARWWCLCRRCCQRWAGALVDQIRAVTRQTVARHVLRNGCDHKGPLGGTDKVPPSAQNVYSALATLALFPGLVAGGAAGERVSGTGRGMSYSTTSTFQLTHVAPGTQALPSRPTTTV